MKDQNQIEMYSIDSDVKLIRKKNGIVAGINSDEGTTRIPYFVK